MLALARGLDAVASDLDRVADARARLALRALVARQRREDRHARALTHDRQLVDRVGALEVRGDEERRVPLLAQVQRELAREGRLAGALEAREHDDGRRVLRQAQAAALPAEDRHELLVDDLDDLLGRVERAGDLGRQGPGPDGTGEVLDDGYSDVSVEERAPDLTDRGVDVRLGETALAPQVLEGRRQSI
ncbi:hypothetical protein D3C74_340840 [compost metagenome]